MSDQFPAPAPEARLGAHIEDDGSTRFTIYAPNKQRVALIGPFNRWDPETDPLEPHDDGTWTITKRLDAGAHRYRFVVDGAAVSDPYARAVRFPDSVREGSDPADSIVRVGDEPYRWRSNGWRRPPFRDLVVYEVALHDFAPDRPGERFLGLVDRLDHLQRLGVNAIEPLPIFGFPDAPGWGYGPTHLFATQPDYGDPDAFRQMVDACHERGVAVILDFVPAHTGTQHPFTAMYPLEGSPWYSAKLTEEKQEFGMPVLDYGKPATRRYISDAIRYWLEDCRVDGFRFDYLKMIAFMGQDAVNFLADAARAVAADAYLIGEQLPEDPKVINRSDLSAAWSLQPGRALRSLLLRRALEEFDPSDLDGTLRRFRPRDLEYDDPSQVVTYIESHDEDRVVRELTDDGDPPLTARRKLALAWTWLCCGPGEVMLYAGQEWGENAPLEKEKQVSAIDFSTLDTDAGRGLFEHHRRLIVLRKEHEAIRTGDVRTAVVDGDRPTLLMQRWTDAGDEVVVVANFSPDESDVNLPLPRGGAWREFFTDSRHDVGEPAELRWKLDPWTAAIFVRA